MTDDVFNKQCLELRTDRPATYVNVKQVTLFGLISVSV